MIIGQEKILYERTGKDWSAEGRRRSVGLISTTDLQIEEYIEEITNHQISTNYLNTEENVYTVRITTRVITGDCLVGINLQKLQPTTTGLLQRMHWERGGGMTWYATTPRWKANATVQ